MLLLVTLKEERKGSRSLGGMKEGTRNHIARVAREVREGLVGEVKWLLQFCIRLCKTVY